MLDRHACERRVYRLATLLTGHPVAAVQVIRAVLGAQPDLRRLDSAHLDRLTVLRSRELEPAALVDDDVPREIADTLHGLGPQLREAWVLSRVYQMPEREMARAMDCSLTASRRHLEQADAAMVAAGCRPVAAARLLLDYTMRIDVPAFYREAERRRRAWMRTAIAIAVAIGALGIIALITWVLGLVAA